APRGIGPVAAKQAGFQQKDSAGERRQIRASEDLAPLRTKSEFVSTNERRALLVLRVKNELFFEPCFLLPSEKSWNFLQFINFN
ncbi:MAG: hypothetical protein US82_C0035G0001, partial [Parcubacteria group bacterium GW2011_GWC1_38_22]